ncbi:transcription factor bHLH30-like [Curcuma longa]|uniref:transcription factor bHLH30-like n=1 Tax=Curcuma longa TaxID=136217 RepID=UPI003D9EC6F6
MDDTGLHHAHDLPVYPPEDQIGAVMTMATDACAANSSDASPSTANLPWPPLLNAPEPPFLIRDHVQERSFLFPNSLPPLPPPPAFYHDLYMGQPEQPDPLVGFMTAGAGINYTDALVRGRGMMLSACSPSSSTFPFGSGLHAELAAAGARMTHQEIMDAKAIAASKSHSEAERRRRERINAHLARLRSLLPSTTKTDKASLLAEVVQHVKELKRQTSEIAEETSPLPTETDELTVDAADDAEGRFVVRASLCCDDRSDLLPDLIKALKALRLRALKAEITTLGCRIKHVLVVTGEDSEDDAGQLPHYSIGAIQEALKAVMERTPVDEPPSAAAGGTKRQRTAPTNLPSILEHRSI